MEWRSKAGKSTHASRGKHTRRFRAMAPSVGSGTRDGSKYEPGAQAGSRATAQRR